LIVTSAAAALLSNKSQAQTCTPPCYPETSAETSAGVVITNSSYPPYNPYRYGAVGNGTTNDTVALGYCFKAAIIAGEPVDLDATAAGAGYLITSPISITGPVTVMGHGIYKTCIFARGCDGLSISAGVTQVTMSDFRINQAVRYSTTPNTCTGINIHGTASSPCVSHIYRDIFIDGFEVAIEGDALQDSTIDTCSSSFGYSGVICKQSPVNVNLIACTFAGGNYTGSVGVQFGDGLAYPNNLTAQGCAVANGCIISQFDTNVWLFGANFCKIIGNNLDFSSKYGVLMQSGTAIAATDNDICYNYMAATTGAVGIYCLNNVAPNTAQAFGNRIVGNTIFGYTSLTYGIYIFGTSEQNNLVSGNTVRANVYDCCFQYGTGHICDSNNWQGGGCIMATPVRVLYGNNQGTLLSNPAFCVQPQPYLMVAGSTPTTQAGTLGIGTTTSPTASAGGGAALPATVLGYLTMSLGGTAIKVPYYKA
jgi:hypothetical protein